MTLDYLRNPKFLFKLKEDVNQYSDAYQYERAEWLGASKSSIQKALKRYYIHLNILLL
ncbi:hypothetical protein [Orientia tsutsugamushi]|uniref:Transposase n=1 Tax=Orientia tsutsugamushi TaxID=784 RepID=A0A2U3QPZ6_ORITS|nr:hypothetical protein [Orientia tsutsugamushi]KJV54446.1 hypothetical protein OTSKATO_1081 [Orientia tsutsugamushi str. Kato PP]SPR03020.1 transposase [Orientia tsutsugamushi]